MIKIIVNLISIGVAAYILPGVRVDSWFTAFVVVVILGLVNFFIKPLLLIFTFPINFLTLGLFTFIINGLMVLLVSKIVPGFIVTGLWSAILFSILISLVSWFLEVLIK